MLSSYVHGTASAPLLDKRSARPWITSRLNLGIATRSSRAIRTQYTYAQLLDQVNCAARGLLALGVKRGDRVGIWSANVAEWVITQYAAAKAGAILVNINPAYRSRELEYALNQSGVSVLVAARSFRNTDYVEMLLALAPQLAACPGRLTGARKAASPASSDLPRGWSNAWRYELAAAFMCLGEQVSLRALQEVSDLLQFDDPVNIQYTSGTTGSPKGATLSHHNILNNGFFVGEALRYTAEDRICTPVPFYHCFGCVMANLAALTHAAAVIMPAESFDPEATLRAIETHRCTSIYGVPTMFITMVGHACFDHVRLESLRTGVMAGSPCPIEVMRQVIDRMHVRQVTICYGMTETSPVSFQSAVDDPIETRVSTVGRIHPHLECKIVSPETGEIVPRGAQGELCTRGYSVMLGYWKNAEATSAAIDAARWMHSGDLAVMREDGYVNITGRIKDMIIRGGENVYPREIEEFLYTHPKVRTCR